MAGGALILGPRQEEPFFHVGGVLGVSLLSEVNFPFGLGLVDFSF